MAKLPDIGKIEEMFREIIRTTYDNLETGWFQNPHIHIFPDIWPNTAGGLCLPGMVACAAMTEEYTSVIQMIWISRDMQQTRKFYGVYFQDTCAYVVEDAPDKFLEDASHSHMAGLSENPEERYGAKIIYKPKRVPRIVHTKETTNCK